MNEQLSESGRNPYVLGLVALSAALLIAAPFLLSSGYDLALDGSSIFSGLTVSEITTGQILVAFGTSGIVGGLFSLALAMTLAGARWLLRPSAPPITIREAGEASGRA